MKIVVFSGVFLQTFFDVSDFISFLDEANTYIYIYDKGFYNPLSISTFKRFLISRGVRKHLLRKLKFRFFIYGDVFFISKNVYEFLGVFPNYILRSSK